MRNNSIKTIVATAIMAIMAVLPMAAQTENTEDSLFVAPPLVVPQEDSATIAILADTTIVAKKKGRDWNTWRPDPKKALWLALVIPGAGQIYNRKYWKLPIFYGGLVGCIYAMSWNDQMYHDYAQAYMDIMDDDPTTDSYNSFLHLGAQINEGNMTYYQEVFRKRKDRYRRWRDLSLFAMIGVYAISVIDAYVDASLSDFDISDDLSLHVAPTIIGTQTERNPVKSTGIGVGCSLTF